MANRGVSGGPGTGRTGAPAPAVEWGRDETGELEELEMVPDPPAERAAPPPAAPARKAGSGGMMKAVVVAVVLILVASSLGAFLLLQPAPGKSKPKPPVTPTDTLADADVFVSEVRPSDTLYLQGTFVELRVGPGIMDLKDWRLTTFDNDSYVFPSTPVAGDPAYVLVNFTAGKKTGSELSLDPQDELALYTPDGKLSDFVRWAGGGADRDPPRGGWAASDAGVYLDAGQTVSRLDFARCNATAWNASPASPGQPNILEFTLSGARQVLWLRSGRNFSSALGTGASPVRLGVGRPVPRSLLQEAAAHLDYALKQVRRLGDPYSGLNSTAGAPVLEFWVTNGSAYSGITGTDGRVALDLGANRHVNSYVCAREMASLVVLARWGVPADSVLFLGEGLVISEGLRSASLEISPGQPSVESLWLEMKNAGLYNPYEHGRNLTVPFIQPWDYDAHHRVNAWLFFDYTDRSFVESGLGPSLAQALLLAKKEPLVALQEQTGRNLSYLFFHWLDWRTSPGFTYASLTLQTAAELGAGGANGAASLQNWTAWMGRFTINFTGSAEFNLSVGASSAGPLNFKLFSSRTGASMVNSLIFPGQARSFLADGLRPLDELVLVAGASDRSGSMSYQAASLPPGPGNLTPPDGSYSLDPRPMLCWSAVAGADRYQLQVASDAAFDAPEVDSTLPELSFQPENGLPEGSHYWRVRGWTPLGNPTAWSIAAQLTIDTVAPFAYPEIDEPKYRAAPEDAWNVTRYTQISFRLNASNGAPETVYYKFSDQTDWTLYAGTFQVSGDDGPRSMFYYSRDAAGNVQPQQSLELFLDNSPPAINVSLGTPHYALSPGDMENVSRATLISLLFSDGGSGVAEATYRIGGQTLPYAAPFNLTGPGGAVLVQIVSKDRLGSQSSLNLRLFLDDSPPGFTVQGLANGTLSKGVHQVTLSASDVSGVASVNYLVDGRVEGTPNAPPYAWDWDTAGETDGDHTVEVVVQDNVGNRDSAHITVHTDNTPPVTGLVFETPRYRLSDADLWNVSSKTKFNLTATDPSSGVAAIWYTVDGAYYEDSSFVLDKSLPDGRHDIKYGSRDKAGNNETAQTVSVVLDNTAPRPTITSPAPASQVKLTVSINASETSGATDVEGCTFSISSDGVNWLDIWTDTNSTSVWKCPWDTTTQTNGNYWVRAVMYDHLGNSSPSMIQVIVVN
jgi:hypothetical protein